jgi:putative glutamine amidotransferase
MKKQNSKPLIGITTAIEEERYFIRQSYVRAITEAGGLPVLLPPIQDPVLIQGYLERIDGLLLSGGGDICPVFFNSEPSDKLSLVYWERDNFEMQLAKLALKAELPILGVCRGHQVLNVATGGALIQDIATEIEKSLPHKQDGTREKPWHSVKINPKSRLAEILKAATPGTPLEQFPVNSIHHQSISKVGKGFKVVAESPDGVIEAIENDSASFVIGVQWHPEDLIKLDPVYLGLFSSLVKASAGK